ncbi:hypothetical protein ABFP60_00190 [Clostridioides difficile]
MGNKLKELFNLIMEEVNTNDEFKKKVDMILNGEEQPKKKVKKKGVIDVKLNPLDIIMNGELELKDKLSELEVIDLKNIIRFYEMDNTNSCSRWKKKDRLINYIMDVSKSRVNRGNVFRE